MFWGPSNGDQVATPTKWLLHTQSGARGLLPVQSWKRVGWRKGPGETRQKPRGEAAHWAGEGCKEEGAWEPTEAWTQREG